MAHGGLLKHVRCLPAYVCSLRSFTVCKRDPQHPQRSRVPALEPGHLGLSPSLASYLCDLRKLLNFILLGSSF